MNPTKRATRSLGLLALLLAVSPAAALATEEICEATVPDDCLTIWQAHALGYLQVTSHGSTGANVRFTNSGPYDICIDEQVLYTSLLTQSAFVDDSVVAGPARVSPGGTYNTYYGSWTTSNGYYQPYLGLPAWWCVEYAQLAAGGATYDYFGERIPNTLAYWVDSTRDANADGLYDINQWYGTYGVRGEYYLWGYQSVHPVFTVGKTAAADGPEAQVTLVVQNIGYVDSTGVVTDTVPAGWSLASSSPAPLSQLLNPDGTTTLTWSVDVDGMDGITVYNDSVVYNISRDIDADVAYLELPEAEVDYLDGSVTQTSTSLQAAVYGIDVDGDGEIGCPTEEICDGIDNDLDGDIDEGFDADADGFADCAEDCVVEFTFCSAEDGLNLLSDNAPAVETYDGNPRWTASIEGAT